MVKKGLKIFGRTLLWALLLGVCYLLFGGALMNDFRASQIEKELSQVELPVDTELIEVTSFVGNTSGTGNHVEIWAGALLHSALSAEELRTYFDSHFDIFAVPHDLVGQYPYFKNFVDFQALNGASNGDGYFVIGSYYDAFTQIDLRGS
jgi:hypothetical protein